jgi:hypothetical protein
VRPQAAPRVFFFACEFFFNVRTRVAGVCVLKLLR